MFEVVVAMRPVPKGRPRTVVKAGRVMTFTPKRSQEFERALRAAIQTEVILSGRETPVFGKGVSLFLSIDASPARANADWDNLSKAICDAANGILWADDRQIDIAEITIDRKGPERIQIRVAPVNTGRKRAKKGVSRL